MRKTAWTLTIAALGGLSLLLLAPPDLMAQWGAIQRGVDAARQAGQGSSSQQPTKAYEGSVRHDDTVTAHGR